MEKNEKIKDISKNVHTNIFYSWNNNYISSFIVYFIFPKTYLETRKEKIYNIADEISGNMNGKEIKYIEQTLELYSKSSEIKAFIKEKIIKMKYKSKMI